MTAGTVRKLHIAVVVLLSLALERMVAGQLIPEDMVSASSAAAEALDPDFRSEQSIAVLPLVNLSADEENEYFSDGLSEELLNLLARIPELQVAA